LEFQFVWAGLIDFLVLLGFSIKACTEKSPFEVPFRKNAPSWCYAPFESEGILSRGYQ
ncbi:hypothetical protein S245_034948, partial [Arachis hypogaea]